MSYSEKYRGTEFGQPDEPPPAAATTPTTGPPTRLPIAMAGVVLLGVAVVVGAAGILSQPPPPPFSRSLSEISRRTPMPTGDPDVVLASFRRLAARPDLRFHMQVERRLSSGGLWLTTTGDMDVVGKDEAGTMTFQIRGDEVTYEYAVRKGVAQTRLAGTKAWQKGDIAADQRPQNPFLTMAAARGFFHAGVERRSGRVVHILRTTRWLIPDVNELTSGRGVTVTVHDSRLDVYVSTTGVPEEARFNAQLTLTASGQKAPLRIRATYLFSEVGGPLAIEAPGA